MCVNIIDIYKTSFSQGKKKKSFDYFITGKKLLNEKSEMNVYSLNGTGSLPVLPSEVFRYWEEPG